MTRRTARQATGRVEFVRPVKDIDEDFEREGFMFLALELEEIPPPPKPAPPAAARRSPTRKSAG